MLGALKRRAQARLMRWEDRLYRPMELSLERRRPADGPPVFVLAAPCSGAEQLSALLDRHPRLACAHETLFLAGLLATLREKNCVTGYRTIGVSHEQAVANVRVLARNYYERFLFVSGKARWVDSTSSHAMFATELAEVFAPGARFVHVVRHGLDVARAAAGAGRLEGGYGHWVDYFHQADERETRTGDRVAAAANLWLGYNRLVREFADRHPGVCHVVRIEDLHDEPESTVRTLCAFLGEEWNPALLDRPRPDDPRLLPHRHHETVGVGRAIEEQLTADLERYGYPVARP